MLRRAVEYLGGIDKYNSAFGGVARANNAKEANKSSSPSELGGRQFSAIAFLRQRAGAVSSSARSLDELGDREGRILLGRLFRP